MPRYRELRQAKDLQAKQVADIAGIDPTLYSKFENYRVLPIPADFNKLLAALECSSAEVYDPSEVALLPSVKAEVTGGSKVKQNPDHYQITTRLENSDRAVLTREVLQKCGYKSINDWVKACVKRLKDQYETIQSAERKPHQFRTNGTSGVSQGEAYHCQPLTTTILTKNNKKVKEAIPQ